MEVRQASAGFHEGRKPRNSRAGGLPSFLGEVLSYPMAAWLILSKSHRKKLQTITGVVSLSHIYDGLQCFCEAMLSVAITLLQRPAETTRDTISGL
jgi:hypothetical protein